MFPKFIHVKISWEEFKKGATVHSQLTAESYGVIDWTLSIQILAKHFLEIPLYPNNSFSRNENKIFLQAHPPSFFDNSFVYQVWFICLHTV